MGDRFLSMRVVLDRVGLSKSHLYRKIKLGEFPQPVPLAPGRVAFLESEIEDWMESRLRLRIVATDDGDGEKIHFRQHAE